jgi:glycosyl transferase/beta-hydroxylase protein BlmF
VSEVPRRKISFLCPARGRPDYVIAHVESILDTIADPSRLELLFYIDRDDPRLSDYEAMFAKLATFVQGTVSLVPIVGDRVGTPKALNVMAARSAGDTLMISNDDLIFVTKAWDLEIDKAASDYPDGIFNIFFDDGYFGDKLSCFPIIGRQWYLALGYVAPVIFEHAVVDWWIHHLGKFMDRNVFLPHVKIEHRHSYDANGMRFNWQEEGFAKRRMERDNAYFRIFERYLRLDADLLRDAIGGKPPRYGLPDEAVKTLLENL